MMKVYNLQMLMLLHLPNMFIIAMKEISFVDMTIGTRVVNMVRCFPKEIIFSSEEVMTEKLSY